MHILLLAEKLLLTQDLFENSTTVLIPPPPFGNIKINGNYVFPGVVDLIQP
jgi:hypothetical protein